MSRAKLVCLILSSLAPALPVRAQLFGAKSLDTKFCEQTSVRQTVVYIDDTTMVEGQIEWARRLSDKLRATLAPAERVTVVKLSPSIGQSSELWSGCWPAYSDAAVVELKKQTYIFQRSPLAALADQQAYFLQGFGAALTSIYTKAMKPLAEVKFSAAQPKIKQIVRALASDDGRFANTKINIRAIVYSDFAENSDLGSVFAKPLTSPPDFGTKLGSYLRRGVFYGFGVGEHVSDSPGFTEAARTFWGFALRSMSAPLIGIGADLNVPNTVPDRVHNFSVSLSLNGQNLDGRLSLLTNAEGDLVDSWIGILRLAPVGIVGTFHCKSVDLEATCVLDATTLGGVATTSSTETISMKGSPKTGLSGKLGVKGTLGLNGAPTMFELITQAAD
jgi:hypothetical protein